jgi:uncharacterized protein YjbJ (UPF0337 family)
MNHDIIEGNWNQLKGRIQQQWGKLTDDQLEEIKGSRKELIGKLQEQYGIARDEAQRRVEEWESRNAA